MTRRIQNARKSSKKGAGIERNKRLRERTEVDLRQLSEAIMNMQSALYIFKLEDLDDPKSFIIIFGNAAVQQVSGVDPESVVGKRLIDAFPEAYHTDLPRNYADVVRTGKPAIVGEVHYESDKVKSGDYFVRAFPLPGHCVGVSFDDITERKQAEEKLRISVERYRTLAESAQDFIYIVGPDLILQYMNSAAARPTQKRPEELVGKPVASIFPPGTSDVSLSKLRQIFLTGEPLSFDEELVFPGKMLWVNTQIIPLKNREGKTSAVLGITRDISERKKAELALNKKTGELRQLSTELEMIIDSIPNLIFYKDRNNRFIRVNRYIADAYGRTKEQLEGMSLFDLHTRDEAQAYFDDDIQVILSRQPKLNIVERWDTEKGIRWVNTSKIPYMNEKGEILGVIGVSEDITERKAAEDALRRAHDELEKRVRLRTAELAAVNASLRLKNLVFDRTIAANSIADTRGVITEANEQFLKIWGYPSKSEVIGKMIPDFLLNPQDADGILAALNARGTWEGEYAARRKDGSSFTAYGLATTITDEQGRLAGYQTSVLDITERKRAEERLRESEDKFKYVFEYAPVGKSITLPMGEISVNEAFCEMLGYSREELEHKNWQDISHHDDIAVTQENLNAILSGEKDVGRFEKRYFHKNGTVIWADVSTSLRRAQDGQPLYFMTTAIDITERKRAEEEKKKIEARLQQQQRLESIGTLASGVAHEINNPVNGIVNYAQLIADRLGADDPLREYTAEIMKESDRISSIVRNLLAFSRYEKQSHSPADLRDIVNSSLALMGAVMRHDQIRLDVDIPESLPKIKCRSQQIQQVIMNLLTNARDALNEKYPGYHEDKIIKIVVRSFDKNGNVWVRTAVENNGTVISPEIREHLFEPFYTTKPKDQGTGLGLSISYGIVKEHHGELYLDSEVGQPTRFRMDLLADNGWSLEK